MYFCLYYTFDDETKSSKVSKVSAAMKPFILLITVFAISIVISKSTTGYWNLPFSGNLAMCLMLCFTGIGHFTFTKGMSMMIPPFIPFKTMLIYGSGILEIILALPIRPYIGYVLIIFFILVLPANIYAATQHLDIEKNAYWTNY